MLGSGEWERQLLMAEEEPPQPAKRPEMPSRHGVRFLDPGRGTKCQRRGASLIAMNASRNQKEVNHV